jgi:hypothetical protein
MFLTIESVNFSDNYNFFKKPIIFVLSLKQNLIIMEVTARINIDSPAGRKLVREIERHKGLAKVEYPLPEALKNGTALSDDQVWEKIIDKMSNHYGTDIRKI